MSNFQIKGFSGKLPSAKPHFFILCKGLNSGKPLLKPCPNCFILVTDHDEVKNTLYWVVYSLWKTKAFLPYLVGSVIPFLRKGECSKLILKAHQAVSQDPGALSKAMALLMDIEQKRKHFQSVAEHSGILHEAILLKLLHPLKKAL